MSECWVDIWKRPNTHTISSNIRNQFEIKKKKLIWFCCVWSCILCFCLKPASPEAKVRGRLFLLP